MRVGVRESNKSSIEQIMEFDKVNVYSTESETEAQKMFLKELLEKANLDNSDYWVEDLNEAFGCNEYARLLTLHNEVKKERMYIFFEDDVALNREVNSLLLSGYCDTNNAVALLNIYEDNKIPEVNIRVY